MRYKIINKKAFTLAEVLITLTIMGIVASITIPSMIYDINNQQYKVAWKKNFAEISQLIKRVQIDNPGIDLFSANLINTFSPYLNYTKACTAGELGESGCFHFFNNIKCLDGSAFGGIRSGKASLIPAGLFILGNGSLIGMVNNNFAVNVFFVCNDYPSQSYPINGRDILLIDVNGFKGPNTIGRDIYVGQLGDRFYPLGTDCDQSGAGCSGEYLYK